MKQETLLQKIHPSRRVCKDIRSRNLKLRVFGALWLAYAFLAPLALGRLLWSHPIYRTLSQVLTSNEFSDGRSVDEILGKAQSVDEILRKAKPDDICHDITI